MRAEALLDLKHTDNHDKRRKRRHLQAVNVVHDDSQLSGETGTFPVGLFVKSVLTALVIGCGALLLKSYAASFKVEHVVVEGEFHNAQALEIERTLKPYLQGDLITIDLAAAHSALTQLKWIDNVRLQRQWPDAVIVNIHEQIPVARWNEREFVNADGIVFTHEYITDSEKLVQLSGPTDKAQQVLLVWNRLTQVFAGHNIQIAKLSVDERSSWTLATADGVVIHLGSDELESRLKRFLAVMSSDRAPDWNRIAGIDLRHSNGFAVSWRQQG